MNSKLRIPSPLRSFTNGQAILEVQGSNIKEILDELFEKYPEIKQHIIDSEGNLRNFVNIFIGDTDIKHSGGIDANVENGSDVRIIPSIAGGLEDLSSSESARYSRHITLPEIGLEGQKKLKAAKVLIIGAGGLGCPVSVYLAAAGVGTIGLADYDVVDESNLQRQILFGTSQIGTPKVNSAKERLLDLNPHIHINLHPERISSENALNIIKDYDIIIDGTDNFPTRYLVNDACVLSGKTNVYGSIYRFDGQVSVFNHDDGPCYRCLYPSPPPPGLVPSCAEGGVMGVLPGIIGSMQANEAIKIIVGIGNPMKGRFLLFDALEMEFQELKVEKDPNCVVCGNNPSVTQLIDYDQFCGIGEEEQADFAEISVQELKEKFDSEATPYVLDVRENFELDIVKINGTIHIPMKEVPSRLNEINKGNEIIVHCKSGARSARICEFLIENGYKNVKNLKGGVIAWAQEIDPSLNQY